MKKKGSLNKSTSSLNQPNKARNFWLLAGLLVVLLCSIMTQFWSPSNNITRPFYGLHSWADAHGPWKARVHVRYGLGYTKGLMTNAVGNPPTKNPTRYLDHPQLHGLLNAAAMAVLGVNTWALRATNVAATIIALLLFLKILHRLTDDKTALLAGLLFCLFPLIGYFGVNRWLYPLSFWAIWCYLVLINGLKNGPKPGALHKCGLAAGLFFALQMSWEGFFFALAVGVHYVFRCIHRRQFPEMTILTILIIAPLSSLILNFAIMATAHGWDLQRIIELYKWRAGSGELKELTWPMWFGRFWEHAITNFTLPILITTILYLTFGQLFVFMETKPNKQNKRRPRQFPQFWLFLMPAIFQLFLLKGALWPHQTWERPLIPFIAIAAAQGVMLLGDALKKINKIVAHIAMTALVAVFAVFCVIGIKHYYDIRWQTPAKIEMFEMLQKKIPPDKALLSWEPFIVNQHKAKGAFYRPEIAWHLDREIVQAGIVKNNKLMVVETLKDIEQKARTGNYPYYLIPQLKPLMPLIIQLTQRYQYQQIPGEQGESKDGKFFRAGMMHYVIFDLNSKGPAT
ncbi:MAG: ArnT family glycosyltransferase [Planctomycetota bacterium]